MAQRSSIMKPSPQKVANLNSGCQFQFVSIHNPDGPKDRKAMRLARSHAVAHGIENKRKQQQRSGENFYVTSSSLIPDQPATKRKRVRAALLAKDSSLTAVNGPFQMLAAESPRLLALLDHHISCQSIEPVVTVSDELVLQNFRSVLRDGLDDHALLSAVMLTFSFAVTSPGTIDEECLGYQNVALNSIRQKMSSPDTAISESTLGAILLLAGIEARLGMTDQVQLHMGAIERLLEVCRTKSVYLSDGIKRAIFWQDLNSSVITGSKRIVDHTTFSELQWKRDPFSLNYFILPPGFRANSHLLDDELLEILVDVHALRCIRDFCLFGKDDIISMAHVDNHQASIQSRLVSLTPQSSISECCRLATYLCSTMIRCKVWLASTVPSHLSLRLLEKLKQGNVDAVWNEVPELLIWLLHIGGAFAPQGSIRSGYSILLLSNRRTRFRCLYNSWPELLDILKLFIWSEKAFETDVMAFWEESLT